MKINKFFLLGLMLLLLPSLVLADSYYTGSSETICELQGDTRICTTQKFSAPAFIDGKSLSEIANTSWDASDRAFLIETESFSFNIKPYAILNSNKIPFNVLIGGNPTVVSHGRMREGRFDTKFSVNLTNLPVGLQAQISAFGYEIINLNGITSEDIVNVDNSLVFDDVLVIDFTDLIDAGFSIEFLTNLDLKINDISFEGGAIDLDPVILLTTTDTENMADTYVDESLPNNNFGVTTLFELRDYSGYDEASFNRWNISMFPPAQSILDAQYCLYMSTNNLDGGTEGFNISSHIVYSNYTWTELGITWNNMPDASYYDTTWTDIMMFDGNSPIATWYCWDVTGIMQYAYQNSYNNVTIMLETRDEFGTPLNNEDVQFRTRNFGTVGLRPYVNVTYEAEDQESPAWFDPSTNTTLIAGETVEFRTRWTDDFELDSWIFSYDNGSAIFVNDTLTMFEAGDCSFLLEDCWSNTTKVLPDDERTICWKYYAHDTYNKWNVTDTYCFGTELDPVQLNVSYVQALELGVEYRITSWYTNESQHIPNATVNLTAVFEGFTPVFEPMLENATGGYYYFDFIYEGVRGGVGVVTLNASADGYPSRTLQFFMTAFDVVVNVRFWNEENMTTPYLNEFMWVYMKPDCSFLEQYGYLGLYDTCSNLTYRGKYENGTASVGAYSYGDFELWVVDGTIEWDCDTCPPTVFKYNYWEKVDEFTIGGDVVLEKDYLWETSTYGYFGFDWDWDFWKSVIGIVLLMTCATVIGWLTKDGLVALIVTFLLFIILKIFGILTGAILWIF